MAGALRSPEGLTLKEVSRLLGVKPRRVQYLRECQIVVPSVIGKGRGSVCRYTFDDVVLLHIVLKHLDDLIPNTQARLLLKGFDQVVELSTTVHVNLKTKEEYEEEVRELWKRSTITG